jgi:hypothetical protein
MGYDSKTIEEADTAQLLGLKIATNFGVGRSVIMMMITVLATYYPMLGLACFALRAVISFMKTVLKNQFFLCVSISLYITGLLFFGGGGDETNITRVFIIEPKITR